MKYATIRHWTMTALLAVCLAGITQAQQQPAPEPVAVGRLSIASVNDIQQLMSELNMLGTNIREEIEKGPFLGAGSVAPDKPLGVALLVADPHRIAPIQDSLVIGLPVVDGKVTPEALAEAGAKAIDGQPGIVSFEEYILRRTAAYLFFKAEASPWGLSAIRDDVFAPDYAAADPIRNLAAMSLNLGLFRTSAPQAYKELVTQITSLPQMLGVGVPEAEGEKQVQAALDKVDRFSLALGRDDKSLHLRSWLSPSPVAARAKEAPRPAFPADTIVQMHVIFPNADAAEYLEKQLTALPEEFFGGELPPVYHGRIKELALQAATLVSATDAVSMGFAVKEGQPVFYLVDQFREDVDGVGEFKSIMEKAVALAAEGADVRLEFNASTYDAAGKSVQRLVLKPEADEMPSALAQGVAIDTIQSGRNLYVAISSHVEGKYVADLAAAGMAGNSALLCAGAIDLGAAARVAGQAGGLSGIATPDKLEELKTKFAGQGITWTVQAAEQNYLFVDIAVPMVVLKELINLN